MLCVYGLGELFFSNETRREKMVVSEMLSLFWTEVEHELIFGH